MFKKWLVVGGVVVLLGLVVGVAWWAKGYVHQPTLTGELVLPDQTVVEVEIADTFLKQQRGLMGRNYLDHDHGMLFVFHRPGRYPFWMKDTQIDLDYIWILHGTVVDLTAQVPAGDGLPDSQVARVTPRTEVDWVLEVPAGFIAEHHLQIGDKIGDRLDETSLVF